MHRIDTRAHAIIVTVIINVIDIFYVNNVIINNIRGNNNMRKDINTGGWWWMKLKGQKRITAFPQ